MFYKSKKNLIFILLIFFLSFNLSGKNLYFNKIKIVGSTSLSVSQIAACVEDFDMINGDILFEKLVFLESFDYIKLRSYGRTLIITVREKPTIHSVRCYGDRIEDRVYKLLMSYRIKSGELYDSAFLRSFERKTESYYSSRGFYNLKLKFKTTLIKNLNAVDVKIFIKKNSVAKIGKIFVNGNRDYSKRKVRSHFNFSATNWISWITKNDVFIRSKISNDVKSLRTFYSDRGYVEFQVNFIKAYISKDKETISMVIDIFEGDKYKFGRPDIIMNGSDELKEKLLKIAKEEIRKRELFILEDVFIAKKKIIDYLTSHSVINSKVNFDVFNPGNGLIYIAFTIEAERNSIVKNLIFIGNYLIPDHVLRKLVPQKENSWISFEHLYDGRENILKLGMAQKVTVTFEDNDETYGAVDVFFDIKEKTLNKLTAGFTYYPNDCSGLNIVSEMPNFWDTGNDLNFNVTKTRRFVDYGITYVNPNFFNSKLDVSYNIFLRKENLRKRTSHFDHASITKGFSISYILDLYQYHKITLGLGVEQSTLQIKRERIPLEVKRFIREKGVSYREYNLTMTYIFNSINKAVGFPTDGILSHFNFKMTLPGSDLYYYHINQDAAYYKALHEDVVFYTYINLFYGNKYSKTLDYPFFKNFYLKGVSNIRGYRDRTLGPRTSTFEYMGGNISFCAKASLVFPVPGLTEYESIRGAIFFDVGQVYTTKRFKNKPIKRFKFTRHNSVPKMSIGVSLTWHTPFAVPIDFSIGYPINAISSDRKKILSFSVGMQS